MEPRRLKIHVWAPGVSPDSGGIEGYSSALIRALAESGAGTITLLAKHDRGASLRRQLPANVHAAGTGDIPLRLRTPAFAALLAWRAVIERPNLIIMTHLNFSPVAACLKRRFGIPYWAALHGIEAWDLKEPARVAALRSADLLLPVSGFTRDRVMKEQGIAPERFRFLPDTFDPDAWEIGPRPDYLLKRYNLEAETAVLLTVGRLSAAEAYKGHDRVLRVLRAVAERMRNTERISRKVRYLIVGDGDDRQRLEGLARDLGVAELVTFTGRVPREELADHYRLCDVFAMPSTGEGFGIVFLEALGCGRPVIGGTQDAAVDALRGGELGVLVDPDHPVELSDAITSILSKTHSHPLIGDPEMLRARTIEHFGFERFRQTVAGMLREAEQLKS